MQVGPKYITAIPITAQQKRSIQGLFVILSTQSAALPAIIFVMFILLRTWSGSSVMAKS
jgi:hypothetical protein